MELVDYVRFLRRRWKLVLLAMLVSTVSAYVLSDRKSPVYEASTRLIVSVPAEGSVVDELTKRTLAISRASVYATYASTRPAVDDALRRAGYAVEGVRPSVTAEAPEDTPFLLVRVTDYDPARAAAVAGIYVESLLDTVAQLDDAPQALPQTLSVVDPAAVPTEPSSPRPVRDAGIGLLIGLGIGIAGALTREALDRTYSDSDLLESVTDLPVLGVVPQELGKVRLPAVSDPESGRAEAYRTIRTNIQFAGPPTALKRIVVTSTLPGEGKTSVASNVAIALARSGQAVVLVDADLRRPQVASVFGMVVQGPGLAGVLSGRHTLAHALRVVDDGALAVLPAGGTVANPSELLGGLRMTQLLEDLGSEFDVVLIDTPPVLPVSDALVLAVAATGVIVVVGLGKTPRERLQRCLGSLRKLDVPILGLVANGSVPSGDPAYGYGSKYGYASRHGRKG